MSELQSVLCCLYLCVFANGLSFSWTNNTYARQLSRFPRQAECEGFQCIRSRECINEDKYCNGRIDCSDGSDETERCRNLGCQGNLFRCRYGACISLKLECDGKSDCKDGSDESSTRCKRKAIATNTKCIETQFQCRSEQCINEDYKCDGKPHCADKSDETEETCATFPCPGYTFRCNYGACISNRSLCDGMYDCFDGSDEDPVRCQEIYGVTVAKPTVAPVVTPTPATPPTGGNRPPPVDSPGSCVLPAQIQNGKWFIWSSNNFDYRPGDRVAATTFLEVNCTKGYLATGSGVVYCAAGKWSEDIPQCGRVCSAPHASPVTNVTCLLDKKSVDCSKPFEGTYAYYSCAKFFELSTTYYIRYCSDGTWNVPEPTCQPECGKKTAVIKELIIGGGIVKRGNYPWTVALYKGQSESYSHVCGGSLISERLVVTAAHCVSNKQNGQAYSEKLYRVAAGKYYRDYAHENDTDAAFSDVLEIVIPPYYKGSSSHYEADIAVLVTTHPLKPTDYIQRICIDYDQKSFYANALAGTNGTVTGWGFTIRGKNPSNELKEITLPFVDYNLCYAGMPTAFKKYVIQDKICAGYLDKGIGVCEGDSGGGLAFENPFDRNRFYLRGVVSTSPQVEGGCDEFKYALYTKVSEYTDDIKRVDSKYQ